VLDRAVVHDGGVALRAEPAQEAGRVEAQAGGLGELYNDITEMISRWIPKSSAMFFPGGGECLSLLNLRRPCHPRGSAPACGRPRASPSTPWW
jgi:hypothetical protein